MRVIAGRLGGRLFASPGTHKTHPMSDKIRGALFNVLGDIAGLTVLDAFAGSGALAFEAVSRGAASALIIESDTKAQAVIAQNIRDLRVGYSVKLIKASANAWLDTNEHTIFDIVLCDPPYDNPQPNLLQQLATRTKSGGIIVFSLPPDAAISLPPNFNERAHKNYGDAQLYFFERR